MGKYLYNGVDLPALPKRDYPYACICTIWHESHKLAHLFLTDSPLHMAKVAMLESVMKYVTSAGKEVHYAEYVCEMPGWEQYSNEYSTEEWTRVTAPGQTWPFSQQTYEPFWANPVDMKLYDYDPGENSGTSSDDIYTDTGEIGLYASDPVPVSPVKLNPALLVQSFFTGQAIRRSRK